MVRIVEPGGLPAPKPALPSFQEESLNSHLNQFPACAGAEPAPPKAGAGLLGRVTPGRRFLLGGRHHHGGLRRLGQRRPWPVRLGLVPLGPLLPDLLVVEHLDEQAADHRA